MAVKDKPRKIEYGTLQGPIPATTQIEKAAPHLLNTLTGPEIAELVIRNASNLARTDLDLIVSAARQAYSLIQRKIQRNFNLGDKVEWVGKRGHREGVIVDILQKNIKVLSTENERWTVSPSLLNKIS